MHGHRALRRTKPVDRSVQPPECLTCFKGCVAWHEVTMVFKKTHSNINTVMMLTTLKPPSQLHLHVR
jgi:hypothetical protein